MGFKEKLEEFIKNSTPDWHISYDQFTYRLKGLHPSNPDHNKNRIPVPNLLVKKLDEDQHHLIEEIQAKGLFQYEIDKETLKIKEREISYNEAQSNDYGNFVRIEWIQELDLENLDFGISILLESKKILGRLLSNSAKDEVKKLLTGNPDYKLRLYITSYNDPNKLIAPIVIPLIDFDESGNAEFEFDGSTLPQDISIYYIKIFNRVNFEVR